MRPGFKSLLTVSVVANVVLVAAVVRSAAPLQSDAVASPVASANRATSLVSPAATPAPPATPMGTPATPLGVGGGSLPGDGAPSSAALLSAVMLAVHQPNELGQVPVLEWHFFTTDPEAEDEYTRTIDDFRADLEWLYAHDFYVVSLRDLVTNRIAAPPGKHPVVLTFDDATAGQFRFLEGADGSLTVDPNSAVGVMEEMYTKHPDFGRGGFFSFLPFNCFAVPDEPEQEPFCDAKLRWLLDHGYEVGNHTFGHADLLDVDDATFQAEIGEAVLWLDEHAPGHDGDLMAMPYGNYPDPDLHARQVAWMRDGFVYEGRRIKLAGALKVGAEPALAPADVAWDPIFIPRVQVFDANMEHWRPQFEDGEVVLYTSDGNPRTLVVPTDPSWLMKSLDAGGAATQGRTVVRYDP